MSDKTKAADIRGQRGEVAKRALAEAEERRRKRSLEGPKPREIGGRKGPEPTRYGDWERDGLAVDF